MPLTERYKGWELADHSYHDQHTETYDHRLEVAEAIAKVLEYPNIKNNAEATGTITILESEWGWVEKKPNWLYDPSQVSGDAKGGTPLGHCIIEQLNGSVDSTKQFCNETMSNLSPPLPKVAQEAFNSLQWPDADATMFICRFTNEQHCIGGSAGSSYHLGNGLMGTAGHCLHEYLANSAELSKVRIVFGWSDVVAKKEFPPSQVWEIETVIFCDFPGPKPAVDQPLEIAKFSRRWDGALFQLKAKPGVAFPPGCSMAANPPLFGSSIYNVGAASRATLKVSLDGHVLRHSLHDGDPNPFSHTIRPYGAFSTDLDQFDGNSGGPVFDKATGKVIGHTNSTASEVQGRDPAARDAWSKEYAHKSKNYTLIQEINPELSTRGFKENYLFSAKNLRCFDPPTFVTAVCPGDIGPNGQDFAGPGCHVVLNRQKWDATEVVHMNLSGRVDRSTIFLSPLDGSQAGGALPSAIKVILSGLDGVFKKPDPDARLNIRSGSGQSIDFSLPNWYQLHPNSFSCTVNFRDLINSKTVDPRFLREGGGLRSWSIVQLEQSEDNAPQTIGIIVVWERSELSFPADSAWPPGHTATTDKDLKWPAEQFHYATTVGLSKGKSRIGGPVQPGAALVKVPIVGRKHMWEGKFDCVWTNPRQPLMDIADPLVEDLDPILK